jgi:hypothetical protein
MPAAWAAGIGAVGSIAAAGMSGGGGGGGGGTEDYYMAQLQAAQDAELARQQNMFNNPDRISNLGSETRVKVPAVKAKPAVKARPAKYNKKGELIRPAREAQPAVKAVPGRWEVRTTLAPEMEATQDAAMKKQQTLMEQAAGQGAFQTDPQIEFDQEGYQKYGDAIYENAMSRVKPEQEHEAAAMHTRLRQQGLQPGTAAYDRAMKNLMTSQGDVAAKAALEARVVGQDAYLKDASQASLMRSTNVAEDRQAWEDPLDRAVQFGAANQGVQNTTLPGYGTAAASSAGVDLVGLQKSKNDAKAAADAAKSQAYGAAIQGIGNAAGTYFGSQQKTK